MTTRLPLNFDTAPATWQWRTLRYLSIYLLLAITLIAVRYKTQHVRPNLLDLQKQEATLLTQRDNLEIAVQVAVTPQRIQEWAAANGMIHFAESPKAARDLGQGAPLNLPTTNNNTIEVKTQWK
ncbi:hypothetical protein [Deinococcus sp.]|uniref:hypothetical protein n=1 Tax=Deinococcus sp. TaxID=47478 RepID=UPI0025C1E19F|nr:hypothetical protein [Deinococcus sp.]